MPSAITCLLIIFTSYTVVAQQFLDASSFVGIDFHFNPIAKMGGGVAIFDYNQDGLEDIYLVGGRNKDGLFRNDNNGFYTNVSDSVGLTFTDTISTLGVVTGDIDNDGIREIFITTNSVATDNSINDGIFVPNILLKFNSTTGKYENIALSAGLTEQAWSVSGSFGDFNKDGFLDLLVINYVDTIGFNNGDTITHLCSKDFFYINQGDGTFLESSNNLGFQSLGCSLAASFTDYDKDADIDIMIANDFGMWLTPNLLFQNNYPSPLFSEISTNSSMNAQMHAMGIASGDYNEDGYLDYYISNIGKNHLFKNNGDGTFSEQSNLAGVGNIYSDSTSNLYTAGWGTGFMDFDNDSYLDLFVSNGFVQSNTSWTDPNKLFKNNGNGTFTDISVTANIADKKLGRGVAFGDLDNDGDLEIIVQNLAVDNGLGDPKTLIYHNILTSSNNWIKFTLEGTDSNFDAYGTLVTVYAGGRQFIQELQSGSSFCSQNSSILHFGLGTITQVDSVIVNWPNGSQEQFLNLSIKQKHHLIENVNTSTKTFLDKNDLFSIYPNPTKGNITINSNRRNNETTIINIYSITGQFLLSKKLKSKSVTLDLSFLDNGVYHLELISPNFRKSKKLILLQ